MSIHLICLIYESIILLKGRNIVVRPVSHCLLAVEMVSLLSRGWTGATIVYAIRFFEIHVLYHSQEMRCLGSYTLSRCLLIEPNKEVKMV